MRRRVLTSLSGSDTTKRPVRSFARTVLAIAVALGIVFGAGAAVAHVHGGNTIPPACPLSSAEYNDASDAVEEWCLMEGPIVPGQSIVAAQSTANETTTANKTATPTPSTPTATPTASGTEQGGVNDSGASVTVKDQNTTGANLTVKRAVLPDGGFIAVRDPGLLSEAGAAQQTIAVSKYLKPGTHTNIKISAKAGPPGGSNNVSTFSTPGTYVAVAARDTDGDTRYDGVVNGSVDSNYENPSSGYYRVAASEFYLTPPPGEAKAPQTASIEFRNQTATRSTVTVEQVTLSEGGFVRVHDERYLPPTNNSLGSVVGISKYLAPGTHNNVDIRLTDETFGNASNNSTTAEPRSFTAVPSLDTNGNQRYDYVRSSGFHDVGYTLPDNSAVVSDTASITPPTGEANTSTTSEPTNTLETRVTPTPTGTDTDSANESADATTGSGGLPWWVLLGGGIVLLIALLAIYGRLQGPRGPY